MARGRRSSLIEQRIRDPSNALRSASQFVVIFLAVVRIRSQFEVSANLLTKLRRDGHIYNSGSRTNPVWTLADRPD
jgi:hypothetical protein